MKNKGVKYSIYGDEYCITNKDTVKRYRIEYFKLTLALIFILISFVGTIVPSAFAYDTQNYYLLIITGVSFVLLTSSTFLAFKFGDRVSSIVYESEEYKATKLQIDYEQALRQEEQRKQKAKELVEAYDILDDSTLSQQERIELLKKYMKN